MLAKTASVLCLAVAFWAFCGALIGMGRVFLSMDTTLILHAVGALVGTAFFSWLYFRKHYYTSPLITAAIFLATITVLDFFVVALLIEKSLAMFGSILETWLPWAPIFTAASVTGRLIKSPRQ